MPCLTSYLVTFPGRNFQFVSYFTITHPEEDTFVRWKLWNWQHHGGGIRGVCASQSRGGTFGTFFLLVKCMWKMRKSRANTVESHSKTIIWEPGILILPNLAFNDAEYDHPLFLGALCHCHAINISFDLQRSLTKAVCIPSSVYCPLKGAP